VALALAAFSAILICVAAIAVLTAAHVVGTLLVVSLLAALLTCC